MKWPESTATVRSVRQQRVEGDRERPRVHAAVPADVLVRLVAPRAGGDLRGQRVVADAAVLHARVEQRPRRRGGVADHGDVDRPVRAERVGLDVDLDDLGARADQRAVARRPAGERGAEGEHEVGLRDQPGGDRRGEAAGDPHRPRRAGEQPVAHRGGGEHGADGVAERLERLARARSTAPRPAMMTGRRRGGDQRGDLGDGGRRRGGRVRRRRGGGRGRRPARAAPGRRAAC